MTAIVTLEQAKKHLREDGADRDDDITLKLSAATQVACNYICRPLFADQAAFDAASAADQAAGVVADDAIRAAILLILGHLDANHEDVVIGTIATEIPMGSRSLLAPYRAMGV